MWIQPKNQEELLARLADARDLATPQRDRENLCACAYTEIKRLHRETLDLYAAGCAESQRADGIELELIALRQRAVQAEKELDRVKPFWEAQLAQAEARAARLTRALEGLKVRWIKDADESSASADAGTMGHYNTIHARGMAAAFTVCVADIAARLESHSPREAPDVANKICSNPEDCCRELSRVWKALGISTPNGQSASENVAAHAQGLADARAFRLALLHEIGGFDTPEALLTRVREILAELRAANEGRATAEDAIASGGQAG